MMSAVQAGKEGNMAAAGVFRVPREFKDEDRWFRYFNKKQAAVLVLTGLADYRIIMAASGKGLTLPAVIAALLLTLVAGGLVMVRLPVDAMYLMGGGITLDQWVFRTALRKCCKKIYTKNAYERSAWDVEET